MIYTSFENFAKVIDFLLKHRLQRDFVVIDDKANLRKMELFLKNTIGASGIKPNLFNVGESSSNSVKCDTIVYGGFNFHFIDISDL
jgi:hypothetical protein